MIRITLPEKVSKAEKQSIIDDPSIRVGVEFEIESTVNIIEGGSEGQADAPPPFEFINESDYFDFEFVRFTEDDNQEIAKWAFNIAQQLKEARLEDFQEFTESEKVVIRAVYIPVSIVLGEDFSIAQYEYAFQRNIEMELDKIPMAIDGDTYGREKVDVPIRKDEEITETNNDVDDSMSIEDVKSILRSIEDEYNERFSTVDAGGSEILDEIQETVGPVDVSDEYHGASRSMGWRVEPDSSLASDNGFELITPRGGLPLDEMLLIIEAVFGLIEGYPELHTSDSSGFHVNISMEGVNLQKDLDRLKLALFMEEGKVFEYFKSRENNQYTQSVLKALQKDGPRTLRQASGGKKKEYREIMNDLKNSVIPEGKHYGINFTKLNRNYVEFRYLGGKDYHTKYNRIRSQILDFAFFLKVATTPGFKRKEYLKKISRLIQDIEEQNEVARLIDELGLMTYQLDNHSILVSIDPREEAQKLMDLVKEMNQNDISFIEDIANRVRFYFKAFVRTTIAQYQENLYGQEVAIKKIQQFAKTISNSKAYDRLENEWWIALKQTEAALQLGTPIENLTP